MFSLFESLYQLQCESNNCDFYLTSEDDKEFYVHSFIVALGIPKIRDIILTPHGKIYEKNTFRVTGVMSNELQLIIQFAYLHRCNIEEDATKALALLEASVRLRMNKLQELALEVFTRNLNMSLAIKLLTPEEKYNPLIRRAVAKAEMYVIRFLAERDEAIRDIALVHLKSLIRDDRLHAPHEEWIAEVILYWINHDRETRLESMPQLLQLLRLGFVAPSYVKFLQGLEDISNNRHARQMLELLHGTVMSVRGCSRPIMNRLPLVLRPRIPHLTVLALGGYDSMKKSSSKVIEVYDHLAERWTTLADLEMDAPRCYHSIEIIGENLYVIGGARLVNGRQEVSSSAYCINLKTMEWRRIQSMRYNRLFFCTATVNGLLYAMGGRQGDLSRLKTCEVYDPRTNLWSRIAPMRSARSDAGVAVLNGKIYVMGGFNHYSDMATAEVYDVESNKWEYIAPLSLARKGLQCVAHQGKIYAIGGVSIEEPVAIVERYDPRTKSWELVAEMTCARGNFGVALLYDQLIVCGGFVGGQKRVTKQVEIYDFMHDKWYPARSLNYAKSALACITIESLEFSMFALGSTPRHHGSLLRDFTRARPQYCFREESYPQQEQPASSSVDLSSEEDFDFDSFSDS